MLHELSFLRAELRAKKHYRESLKLELQAAREGRLKEKADSLIADAIRLESAARESREKATEFLTRHLALTKANTKRDHKQVFREIDLELQAIRGLIGLIRNSEGIVKESSAKGNKTRKILERNPEITLSWLRRYMQAIKSKDDEQIERLTIEFATLLVERSRPK